MENSFGKNKLIFLVLEILVYKLCTLDQSGTRSIFELKNTGIYDDEWLDLSYN